MQQLVRTLPERYIAEPRVHLGAEFEVDIAAFEEIRQDRDGPTNGSPSSLWSAAQPTLTLETELADTDQYEVRIYEIRRHRRLVAAVELISPSNKDRSRARAQFV